MTARAFVGGTFATRGRLVVDNGEHVMQPQGDPSHDRQAPEPEQAESAPENDRGEPSRAFSLLLGYFREYCDYASYYASVKLDEGLNKARRIAVALVFGGIALCVLVCSLVMAAWFVLTGIAGGLTELFQSQWLGNLFAGLLVIVFFILVAALGWYQLERVSLKRTIEKYERRQQRQQARSGRSVASRAAQPPVQ
jgi:multisubunit Na+/H+ antiporter MnhG subunit